MGPMGEGNVETALALKLRYRAYYAREFARQASVARPHREADLGCPLGTLMYPTILSLPIWLTTSSRGTRVPRV